MRAQHIWYQRNIILHPSANLSYIEPSRSYIFGKKLESHNTIFLLKGVIGFKPIIPRVWRGIRDGGIAALVLRDRPVIILASSTEGVDGLLNQGISARGTCFIPAPSYVGTESNSDVSSHFLHATCIRTQFVTGFRCLVNFASGIAAFSVFSRMLKGPIGIILQSQPTHHCLLSHFPFKSAAELQHAIMQRGTTILQYLSFRSTASFSNLSTTDGKLWNSALKHVSQIQG